MSEGHSPARARGRTGQGEAAPAGRQKRFWDDALEPSPCVVRLPCMALRVPVSEAVMPIGGGFVAPPPPPAARKTRRPGRECGGVVVVANFFCPAQCLIYKGRLGDGRRRGGRVFLFLFLSSLLITFFFLFSCSLTASLTLAFTIVRARSAQHSSSCCDDGRTDERQTHSLAHPHPSNIRDCVSRGPPTQIRHLSEIYTAIAAIEPARSGAPRDSLRIIHTQSRDRASRLTAPGQNHHLHTHTHASPSPPPQWPSMFPPTTADSRGRECLFFFLC
jgi:hypothetical protein